MKIPYIAKKPERTSAGHLHSVSIPLLSAFTLKSRFDEIVRLYKKLRGNKVLIPVQCGIVGDKDTRIIGQDIDVISKFVPRTNEQLRLVNESTQLLQQGESHILQASTGFGKSCLAAEIAGRVGKKFLIIVPKSDILGQWVKTLKMVLGFTNKEIGIIQANQCSVAGKKAVIAMVHSICKDGRYPSWVYKEFGLIVVDEVHLISATTFSNAMWLLPSKLRLGLSATPYRQDGKDFVFYAHIGRVRVKSENLNLIPKVIVKRCNLPITARKIIVEQNGQLLLLDAVDAVRPGRTMGLNIALAHSVSRNRMIAEFVYVAYKKGRNIIIFSDSRDVHLTGIELELWAIGVKRQDIGWYVGGMKKAELEQSKEKAVILSTYKMMSHATDIPWMDTCVLATPRTDVVQIVGRILREYPDKKTPLVFDIVDTHCDLFMAYGNKRRRWYNKIGAEIVEMG